MLTKFIAKDGTLFNSKKDCLNYELNKGFIYVCQACNGTKGHYKKKLVKYTTEIYDRWTGGDTPIEIEEFIDTFYKCKYCDGIGFIEKN